MGMNPESKFKATLLKDLRAQGHFISPIENAIGRGIPDLAWPVLGNTLWIELKAAPTCYLRKEQYVWHLKASQPGRNIPILTLWKMNTKGKLRLMGIKGARLLKNKAALEQVLWEGTYEEFIANPLDICGTALQAAHEAPPVKEDLSSSYPESTVNEG